MAEDEPDIIIDRDGNVRPGPGADEDTARGIKEIDMDDIEDDSDGGGGSGGGSSSRSAEDFDPDDYPFAKSVEELGEIRREEYGLTNQEKRRVERGEDPVPDGGEGFAVYDPEFDGGSGEVIGTGDTEEEAATAAVRTRVSQAREQRGTTRFNQGLPFDVTDDQVEEQQVRELENREQTLRQREQDIQETINRLPDAERLNIEGTSLEGEFDSNVVSRDQLKTYFQDQQTQLRDTREQVSNQRENVRFELSQVQRPERTQIDTFDPSPDPAEPQTGLSGRAVETADRFRNTLGTDPDPGEPMTGFFSTDTAFGYQGPAIRGPGESNTIETGVENPSGTSIQGTSFLDQQGIRSEEALNDFTDPFGERIRDRLNLEDDRTAKDTPEDVELMVFDDYIAETYLKK